MGDNTLRDRVHARIERLFELRYTIIDRPGPHDHLRGWRNRCTYCGHRVAGDGEQLVETRRRPWRIPSEIVGRYRAMSRSTSRRYPGLRWRAAEGETMRYKIKWTDRPAVPCWSGGGVSPHWPPKPPPEPDPPWSAAVEVATSPAAEVLRAFQDVVGGHLVGGAQERPSGSAHIPRDATHLVALSITPEHVTRLLAENRGQLPPSMPVECVGVDAVDVFMVPVGMKLQLAGGHTAGVVVQIPGVVAEVER